VTSPFDAKEIFTRKKPSSAEETSPQDPSFILLANYEISSSMEEDV
jgi:hypothetical protein